MSTESRTANQFRMLENKLFDLKTMFDKLFNRRSLENSTRRQPCVLVVSQRECYRRFKDAFLKLCEKSKFISISYPQSSVNFGSHRKCPSLETSVQEIRKVTTTTIKAHRINL